MKKLYKSLLSILLAVTMLFSTSAFSQAVYAVSEVGSTENIDGEEETTVNSEVFFVSVANGNFITVSGVKNDPILVDKKYTTPDDVTRSGIFTTYFGTFTNYGIDDQTNEVVNFATSSRNSVWKADDNDVVYQHSMEVKEDYSPTGWESVRIQHNDDGTISFASSADEKIFTLGKYKDDNGVEHTKLAVSAKYHLGDKVGNEEKFIMYSADKPKKARKVSLTNIAGNSVDVSWTVPTEQMYAGFEVLYSTSENGNYRSAGITNKTKMTVNHLSPKRTYYFKIRTLTNAKGTAAYSA